MIFQAAFSLILRSRPKAGVSKDGNTSGPPIL